MLFITAVLFIKYRFLHLLPPVLGFRERGNFRLQELVSFTKTELTVNVLQVVAIGQTLARHRVGKAQEAIF